MLKTHNTNPSKILNGRYHHTQLDAFLKAICLKIQLTDTQVQRVQKAYEVIEDILRGAPDDSIIHKIDLKVYAQGSLLSDTTVKPIHGGEFDLDVVIRFNLNRDDVNPKAVQAEILKLLQADLRYKDKAELKSRCVRINYKGDFHVDLMPAVPEFVDYENDFIWVPHKQTETLFTWQLSGPIPLNNWFDEIERKYKLDSVMLNEKRASIEIESLPIPTRYKSNLKYILQLLKQSRNHYYKNDDDCSKIARSIALQVLVGTHFQPFNSLAAELHHIVKQIIVATSDYNNLHIYNPTQSDRPIEYREDFAEKLRQNRSLYNKFRKWIRYLEGELSILMEMEKITISNSSSILKELFNENPVNSALNEFGGNVGTQHSSNNLSMNGATGLIMGGGSGSIPIKAAGNFGGDAPLEFYCQPVDNKISILVQMNMMNYHCSNFTSKYSFRNKDKVIWTGKLKPTAFSDDYTVQIVYRKNRHPIVSVISHDVSGSIHLYPDSKLCLYHPYDGENRWRQDQPIATTIIPWISTWLLYWEIWKETGIWNGEEHPHKVEVAA